MIPIESHIEDAALEWFGELGYTIEHGPQLAPDEPATKCDSFAAVALVGACMRPSGGSAKKKAEVSLVRSSAAEYLTFVAASGQGGVEAVYADENVWLSQKMMGVIYAVETHTVNYHLKKLFDDAELEAGSVIRNFRITAADGKTYDTQHYNLSAIIAVGYKVN